MSIENQYSPEIVRPAFRTAEQRETIITAWASKYALTLGVEELQMATDPEYPGMASVRPRVGCGRCFHGEGLEWHRTREEAVARAKVVRDKMVKNLEKKIAKLRAMTFD